MDASCAAWLDHPLAEPMLRFNLLPSLLLHPAQAERLLPESLRQLLDEDSEAIPTAVLHRHWSAALRRELNLGPVDSLEEPTLPIALLDAEGFERLGLWCGIALLATSIRRTIAREDVAMLQAQLGRSGIRFARRDAVGMLPGGEAPVAQLQSDAAAQASLLGSGLLWSAFGNAGPAVAGRARLRLAPDACNAVESLPGFLADGPTALTLATNILEFLDPPWLSSFPTRH